MAVEWSTLDKLTPANNQIVWIRILSYYGRISIAQYKASQQIFILQLTSIEIPAYQVSRWKNYP